MIRFGEKAALLLALTVLGVVLLADTADMRSDVALVPRVLGWPFLVLSALLLLGEVFPTLRKRIMEAIPGTIGERLRRPTAAESEPSEHAASERGDSRSLYLFLLWMSTVIALVYMLGIFWATGIGMFLWVKVVGRGGWPLSIGMGAGTFAFIYGVFVLGFDYEYFMRPVMQ